MAENERMVREKLFEMVWARPMSKVAPELGLSDVGLAKICRRHEIPFPPRGYWAKKKVGKAPDQPPLPRASSARLETIWLKPAAPRVDAQHPEPEEQPIDAPVVGEPTFPNDAKVRMKQLRELVGEVHVRAISYKTHPEVRRLLDEDEQRRSATSSRWSRDIQLPRFDDRVARRRLRFVNALFLALERHGATATIRDEWARELQVLVEAVPVFCSVTVPWPSRTMPAGQAERMLAFKLMHLSGTGPARKTWNEKQKRLEDQASEIVIAVLTAGEDNRREMERREYHRRRIEEQHRIWEEEGARQREREAAIEKLSRDAGAYRLANDIRALVGAVRAEKPVDEETDKWCEWALRHAEAVDPVRNGTATKRPNFGSHSLFGPRGS